MQKVQFILILFLLFSCNQEENKNQTHEIFQNKEEDSIDSGSTDTLILVEIKESKCLLEPSLEYMELKKKDPFFQSFDTVGLDYSMDEIYYYLVTHYDSISEKQLIEGKFGDSEHSQWKQGFSSGITYTFIKYDSGNACILETSCDDFKNFYSVISKLIYYPYEKGGMPKHYWYKDSTYYGPGNDVGCHNKLKRNKKGNYFLEQYCGC
ncbi:MAG: hypothetical protein R2799_05485 [Crocinitomicaceae bacterium]